MVESLNFNLKKKVYEEEIYTESWFNAKYLAIAKSYPIYKRLLKKHGKVDLNFLQIKALKLLKNPKLWTNIVKIVDI